MRRIEDDDRPGPWVESEIAVPASPGITGMSTDVETGPAGSLLGVNRWRRGRLAWKIRRRRGRRQHGKAECSPNPAHCSPSDAQLEAYGRLRMVGGTELNPRPWSRELFIALQLS